MHNTIQQRCGVILRKRLSLAFATVCLLTCFAHSVAAEPAIGESSRWQRGDRLLPPTTTFVVTVRDADKFAERFGQSPLGRMAKNDKVGSFVTRLREQLIGANVLPQIGVPWTALKESSGPVWWGLVRRESACGVLLIADVSEDAGQTLLKKALDAARQTGATVQARTMAERDVNVLSWRQASSAAEPQTAFLYADDQWVISSNDERVLTDVLIRLAGNGTSLADSEPFQAVMQRSSFRNMATALPDVRWFLRPIELARSVRTLNGGKTGRSRDMIQVASRQGFDAVQGIGGYLAHEGESGELLHQTFVYAPRDEQAAEGDKYRLGARILDFPNSDAMTVPEWVPGSASTCVTLNWKMREAFEYLSTIVDDFAESEVFEQVLHDVEHDPAGPQINVRNEFIDHLGERLTVIQSSDEQGAHWAVVAELRSATPVRGMLEKAMQNSDSRRHEIAGQLVWEIREGADLGADSDFGSGGALPGTLPLDDVPETDAPFLSRAYCVLDDRLYFASDVGFMNELLASKSGPLRDTPRYIAVNDSLNRLGGQEVSFSGFIDMAGALEGVYRQWKDSPGKIELFAGFDAVAMEVSIDPEKLPDFDDLRPFLATGGFKVSSLPDGWLISGTVKSE